MRIAKYAFSICAVAAVASAAGLDTYVQTNLVSDIPGMARTLDPNLKNPWGIVAGPTSPFWINDNKTGLSTLYNGSGNIIPLVVTVPAPAGSSGPSAPTGIVFTGTMPAFGGNAFIFDTEDGTISAWKPADGTTAVLQGPGGAAGSVYKGLAVGTSSAGAVLYATNFGLGRIDVFNSKFQHTTLSGSFTDPNLPKGYAPFNIQNIGDRLYVTYALQDSDHKDDVAGPGHGFVDVFDLNGHMLRRVVSQSALNSPWGLALAPGDFGKFSNDLLVGNFGNGWINAFNPRTGAFIGSLDGTDGSPIVIQGLWGLDFGNGAQGQLKDALYFTAGIPGSGAVEDHGLYGSLLATPEPQSAFLIGLAGISMIAFSLAQRNGAKASRKRIL
ncbi:MAG TPA: TIGR03118 family protein [Bryobacteraceae bacterium]|jgi:uncharacterized protein (TIGR03118 family)|nr:TIGR03118 family protein [Bryobacteraceae bacterium]